MPLPLHIGTGRAILDGAVSDNTPRSKFNALLQARVQAGTMPGWWRFNETSGTTVANYGYAGAAGNGTWTPGTGAQGAIGAGLPVQADAYTYDGANSRAAIASNAVFKAAAFTWGFLVKPSAAGEGGTGQFAGYADAGDTAMRFDTTLGTFLVMSVGATGAGISRTNASGIRPILNAWQLLFFQLSAADKKAYIYRGYQGSVDAFTYTTQTAWTGTQNGSAILTLGSTNTQTRTFVGDYDDAFFDTTEMSPAEMLALTLAMGV